jgi:hypothetical protein
MDELRYIDPPSSFRVVEFLLKSSVFAKGVYLHRQLPVSSVTLLRFQQYCFRSKPYSNDSLFNSLLNLTIFLSAIPKKLSCGFPNIKTWK